MPVSLGRVRVSAKPGLVGALSVIALALPLPLNRIAPVLVLAVPSVRALAPCTANVPVKLAALPIV